MSKDHCFCIMKKLTKKYILKKKIEIFLFSEGFGGFVKNICLQQPFNIILSRNELYNGFYLPQPS